MTPSGRLVFADSVITVDGNEVLAIDGCGPDDDGTFALGYTSVCEVCDGHGFRHGQRCEYCGLDAEGRHVGFTMASFAEADALLLWAWALRHQFREEPHVYAMARTLILGIREWGAMLAGAQTERSPEVRAA